MKELKYYIPSQFNHGNIDIPRFYNKSKIEKNLKDCHLVFVASVGREGSGYISNLFQNNKHVISNHESKPFCNGKKIINECLKGNLENRILKQKFANISSQIGRNNATTYLESNHMFLKTFGNFFLKDFDLPFTLISMRRPIVKTVMSFLNLNWFSDRYIRSENWVYKINKYSYLPTTDIIIEGVVDEIVAYIVSEKINEIRFKKLSKDRIDYIKFYLPPTKKGLTTLNQYFNNIELQFNLVKKNSRDADKQGRYIFEDTQDLIIKFFNKNINELSKRGIIFSEESLSFSIEDESWSII